ncbi:MAG: low specificity L-threonine aldolase [Myxococcales bacterium]|nr:low specificity L-threonine aldolase [Myxococcales bacterium]
MAASPDPALGTRYLNGHGPRRPADGLRRALEQVDDDERADIYGTGPLIERFESEIADLLGTETAIFMPSGTTAQQIAFRICCDRTGNNKRVAMHTTSHLQLHEEDALRVLHGLEPVLLANSTRMFNHDDLLAMDSLPAAVLWELPQREIGGQLPSWQSLCEQVNWCRKQGIHCHLDGARLWEASPFYDRSFSEIASLFDSIYVSFYKGLGGIAGAILAGKEAFIRESRPWLRRHGGNLISLYPYVLSAKAGMKRHLGQFDQFWQRTQAIADVLRDIEGITVVPEVPQTCMMHLHIDSPAVELNAMNKVLMNRENVVLFGKARALGEERSLVELSIGTASATLGNAEVQALFQELIVR